MTIEPSTPQTLGFAVWSDNLPLAQELLNAGADVDAYGSDTADEVTPLMEAVDEPEPFFDANRIALTQLLLSAGADVASRDRAGRTALHYAAGAGGAAVGLLLDAGADPNAVDLDGATPLHEAILRGNLSAIEVLSRRGANLRAEDNARRTPAALVTENEGLFTPEELASIMTAITH